jgi:hypothetical protein
MAKTNPLLVNIFQAVTQTLADNQNALDKADDLNHDHGTNMVQTFETITNALLQKKDSPDSTALAYAAKLLNKEASSGSSKLYAQGLNNAADQFKGKKVDAQSAVQLLQTLIGGGQSQQATDQTNSGDLLGALLGGSSGGEGNSAGSDNGLDMGDLLNAGLAFMQSKQSGGSNAESIIQALAAASGMGSSAHRAQSTQLVVNTFMQALSAMSAGAKK